MTNKRYPKILAIVGPTAVGKTELSIRLASKIDGEIVSVDSRQIYKYMDIGTSKPTHSSMNNITHHLVDSLCPDQEYNLAIFLERANIAISDILSRNKVPIIVGGTGQYFWGLIEGWSIPTIKPNLKLRKDLTDISQYVGKETLKRHLSAIDKKAYKRIDLNNPRRLIRAIELANEEDLMSRHELVSDLNKLSNKTSNPLKIASHWHEFGAENTIFQLLHIFNDLVKLKLAAEKARITNLDLREDLQGLANTLDLLKLVRSYDYILLKYRELTGVMNYSPVSILEEIALFLKNYDATNMES